jgi:cytoskeletal protein CcmA (bactofilin family)
MTTGMRTRRDHVKGDLSVDDHLAFFGLCSGSIVVQAGGNLELFGTCGGNVDVLTGGQLHLTGTVAGDVTNRGGSAYVAGTIKGNLTSISGDTRIEPKASVKRQVH